MQGRDSEQKGKIFSYKFQKTRFCFVRESKAQAETGLIKISYY